MKFSSFESGAVVAAHNKTEAVEPVTQDIDIQAERFSSPESQARVVVEQELNARGFEGMEVEEKISVLKEVLAKYEQVYVASVNADTPEKKILKFNSYYVIEEAAKVLTAVEADAAKAAAEYADWAKQYASAPESA